MLKIFGITVGVLAVAVVALLAYAATRPDTFRVARSITIKAPPEKIFGFIDDFHRWGAWSPYEKMDPAMTRTFEGAQSGKGAAYAWAGKKVGEGRMEILETTPSSKIVIKLDFTKPMTAHNTAIFTLQPQGEMTEVTWAMEGASPYMAKIMGLVFSMDAMVGKDFETGLSNLKAEAEK